MKQEERAVERQGGNRTALSPQTVRAMGAAAGLSIDDERLPAVQAVLGELLDLADKLERLDLEGVEPDDGDPRAGWEDLR
jgi:Asp-tRNA(Asn)/Glu-tRNA(Gln) amidotransferase C subunit